MIEGNLISCILDILGREGLSDYTLEYTTALLMNLSLRGGGKEKMEERKEVAMEVCGELMESGNEQVRTFINGTLYSMLSRKSFREYARSLRYKEKLEAMHESADERQRKQLAYMLEQLGREKEDEEEASDDEENDLDDLDDFEDAIEEDEQEELHDNALVGEELLSQEFALEGADGEKQRQLTESIVQKDLGGREQARTDHEDSQAEQKTSKKDIREVYAFQSRPKIPRTPPIFFDKY